MHDTTSLPPISSRYNLRPEPYPAPYSRRAQRPSSRLSGRHRRIQRTGRPPSRIVAGAGYPEPQAEAAPVEFALKPLLWTLGIWGLGLAILALAWAFNQTPETGPSHKAAATPAPAMTAPPAASTVTPR